LAVDEPATPDPRPDPTDHGPSELARSAGLAGAATLTSRILGLVRESLLAALFGASDAMDAYIVAFRIPNLVRDLFAEGAMSAAFVPTFTRHLTLNGRQAAWRVANNVITVLALVTGALVVLGIVFARPIVTAYAGDYADVPGKLQLTITLTRVMLPFLVLAAVAAAAMGILNSLHHYFVPSLAPAMFNVATIVCAVLLVPVMPAVGWPPIMAIAMAVILGGIGQIAVQWPLLAREGFRYRPLVDLDDPGLRRVLLLMGPGTIALAATQINLFVNTLLATSQGTGAASWLTYAFRLMYLPIGLFGVSIATAVLPAAARHASIDDAGAVRATVSRGLALMLMLNVPATLGLIALSTPIVRLLFERGEFTVADTAATAAALRLYALGLIGYSTARITSPVFYALGDSRVPVAAGVVSVMVNLAISIVLVRVMGFAGLALGTSLAALSNGTLLLWLLRRRLQGIGGRRLAATFLKVLAAALAMAATAVAVEQALGRFSPDRSVLMQIARLAAAIGAALTALVLSAKILRIHEFDESLSLVRERVQKLLGSR
jgi:putative peptidoglycan lipid II flippase